LCFFFQAEDGIRDPLVTGVQTCALPIWDLLLGPGKGLFPGAAAVSYPAVFQSLRARKLLAATIALAQPQHTGTLLLTVKRPESRSEERRVGKECRYRRSPSDE